MADGRLAGACGAGYTLDLLRAVAADDFAAISKALQNGIDPNTRNEFGHAVSTV